MAKVTVRRSFTFKTTPGLVGYDAMLALGNQVRDEIVRRTESGLDESRRRFRPYSPGYALWKGVHPSHVTLRLSGDMLDSFRVLWASLKAVRIGWPRGSRYEKRAEFNIARGRRFLGIPRSWEHTIAKGLGKKVNIFTRRGISRK